MTPLARALDVALQSKGDDGTSVYSCELDCTWRVGAVPQGGYSLGVLVEACIKYMSGSSHMDPIHVSAHFLQATSVGSGEVHVRVIKTGNIFSNLLASLVQQGQTKISAHFIFGTLPPPGEDRKALSPTSPYARRLPFTLHPGSATSGFSGPAWSSVQHYRFSLDEEILSRNDLDSPRRTTSTSIGGGGTEWAAWCKLTSEGDGIKTSTLPFFADSSVPLPMLLPESEPANEEASRSWPRTITMSVEFKARLPSSEEYSDRTIGIYCESRFLHDPQARHNARVELWTAPCLNDRGEPAEGWRERQYCLAIADQMCLMLPMDIDLRKGTKEPTTLSKL